MDAIKSNIIFGAGSRGEKFLIQYYNVVEVRGVFDNQKTGSFHGYPISRPCYMKNVFIIVAVESALAYMGIRKQLIELGYKEFEDFIPYTVFNKKIALAYGNCHMEAIRKFLECNKEFSKQYGFYPFPGICDLNSDVEYETILPHIDFFLHQSIRQDNRYGEEFSSCYMLNKLSKKCETISLPNLYGLPKCFFPQLDVEIKYKSEAYPYFIMDRNVVQWLKEGKTVEEITNNILKGVYCENEILDQWERFKEKLFLRESEWDVKISDYILGNYQEEKLFCDMNHISAKLAKEIANRVLHYIGIQTEIVQYPIGMDALETFIYPDVRKALGLKFEEKIIRQFSLGASCSGYEMDFKEYIEQICSYTVFVLKDEEN